MINHLVKFLTNKDIILIAHHRNSFPLIKDKENRKHYIFINILYIWRIFPFPGHYKIKYIVVNWLLNIISPKYIIDINWTTKWQSLYKVWTKKHPKSKFIVLQHGSYSGGIVTDTLHRFTKCDIFLCWSDYFKQYFSELNDRKKVKIYSFGNTVYNAFDRNKIIPKSSNSDKVLLLPSAVPKDMLQYYYKLIYLLRNINLTVFLKQHNYQGKKKEFPIINNIKIVNLNIYHLLNENDYELIIADHTSAMLDAIFFKNSVLYFSPTGKYIEYSQNKYAEYLPNIINKLDSINSKNQLINFINIEAQEHLFNTLVSLKNNNLYNLNL